MRGCSTVQREMIDHPLFKGQPQRAYAWLWLLSKAAWKRTPFDIKGVIVTLERGQVCTSRHQLAAEWGMSPSAVERFLTRLRSEEHTSELQSLMRISYAVFCLQQKKT